jgi:hypothetical protein
MTGGLQKNQTGNVFNSVNRRGDNSTSVEYLNRTGGDATSLTTAVPIQLFPCTINCTNISLFIYKAFLHRFVLSRIKVESIPVITVWICSRGII